MSFKIYTKVGDKGTTSLIGGTKVSKSNIRIESYGTIDELNSHIGMLMDYLRPYSHNKILKEIQDRLFTIGSMLATDPDKNVKMKLPDLHKEDIELLENEIDEMEKHLQPMRSFILPGGSLAISQAHIARCVCRRAERICVSMQEEKMEIDSLILQYLNRLSDYLFVLSRYIAFKTGVEDIPWVART